MTHLQQTIANRYAKSFATISKLAFGLSVLCFIAYSEFFAQTDEQDLSQKKQEYRSSISMLNGTYTVDTAVIWSDKNKHRLLDDLALEELEEKKTEAEFPGFIRAFLDSISPGKNSGSSIQVRHGVQEILKILYSPVCMIRKSRVPPAVWHATGMILPTSNWFILALVKA